MTKPVYLLHITDPHLSSDEILLKTIDDKLKLKNIDHFTTEGIWKKSLESTARFLRSKDSELSAVLLTGDIVWAKKPAKPSKVRDDILSTLGGVGLSEDRIVVVPGNHDVSGSTDPSSYRRYQEFINDWRASGCITPLLDGADGNLISKGQNDWRQHCVSDKDAEIGIFPLNSSNWSHSDLEIDEGFKEFLFRAIETAPTNKQKVAYREKNSANF